MAWRTLSQPPLGGKEVTLADADFRLLFQRFLTSASFFACSGLQQTMWRRSSPISVLFHPQQVVLRMLVAAAMEENLIAHVVQCSHSHPNDVAHLPGFRLLDHLSRSSNGPCRGRVEEGSVSAAGT